MKDDLMSVAEVSDLIRKNKVLAIFGAEHLLDQLPNGNWVGGTMPYFYLKGKKGVFDQERLYVSDFTEYVINFKVHTYSQEDLNKVALNGYDNGFNFLILPAASTILQDFAYNSDEYEKVYDNPLVGIIAGVNLQDLAKGVPSKVFNGSDGASYSNSGVALHASISPQSVARLEIINVFEPDTAVELNFEESAFTVRDCLINGERKNLYDYLKANNVDIKGPIVSNYAGANINVSFESLNEENRTVTFYAPVFKSNTYYFSKPVEDYAKTFAEQVRKLQDRDKMIFNCNCILNYVYGDLEKNDIGYSGPTAFGEIAYNLVNQTFTYMVLDKS